MLTLDTQAIWTRILTVTAGARAAAGAPGPCTRIRGVPARDLAEGPWLLLLDFAGLSRPEQRAIEGWLARTEPLLLVRHLLCAKPLRAEIHVELTAQALQAMPHGFREEARPILILQPAGRGDVAERRRAYVEALSSLRLPLTSGGSALWAVREYDPAFFAAMAELSSPEARAELRAALDASQRHLFDAQFPLAQLALLDDLLGGRDEEDELSLDLAALSALHPEAHPLAVYAAVERAHNRRRAESGTQFSARTVEARLAARGFPESVRACTPAFAARAGELTPVELLPGELQRLFEAADLLAPP